MKRLKELFFILMVCLLVSQPATAGENPKSRFLIKDLTLCTLKPRALGRYSPVGEEGFKRGDNVYLYMEARNLKTERRGKNFTVYLVMDLDIYFEDGRRIYSEKDVKSFSPESERDFREAMLWLKIETDYLECGEYKLELTVRNETEETSAFGLKRFTLTE